MRSGVSSGLQGAERPEPRREPRGQHVGVLKDVVAAARCTALDPARPGRTITFRVAAVPRRNGWHHQILSRHRPVRCSHRAETLLVLRTIVMRPFRTASTRAEQDGPSAPTTVQKSGHPRSCSSWTATAGVDWPSLTSSPCAQILAIIVRRLAVGAGVSGRRRASHPALVDQRSTGMAWRWR